MFKLLNPFEDHLTPVNTWFPNTSDVRDILDRDMFLSSTIKNSQTACNPKLYDSIYNLCSSFVDQTLPKPEVF